MAMAAIKWHHAITLVVMMAISKNAVEHVMELEKKEKRLPESVHLVKEKEK